MDVLLSLCRTCLSDDRALTPIFNLKNMFSEINFWELSESNGGLCWECCAIIRKFYKFKMRATQAQLILNNMLQVNNIMPLSSLQCHYESTHFGERNENGNEENASSMEMDDKSNERDSDTQSDEEYLLDIKNKSLTKCDGQFDIVAVEEKKPIARNLKKLPTVVPKYKSVKYALGTKVKCDSQGDAAKLYTTIVFTEEEILKIRQNKVNQPNYVKVTHKCHSCVKGFQKLESLEKHLVRCHSEKAGDHICTVCNCRFKTVVAKDRHERTHFELHKCNLCSYESTKRSFLDTHIVTKHGSDSVDNIHCPTCDEVFDSAEALTQHTESRHRFACDKCSAHYKRGDTLRTHKRRVHGSGGWQHKCDECNLTFKSSTRLESHLARHGPNTAKALSYCKPCGLQFKSIYNYRKHLKNSVKHVVDVTPCPVCGVRFASRTYLTKHIQYYHLKQTKYRCEECDRNFISKWQLRQHQAQRHGGPRVRLHACQYCTKRFYTKHTLRCHQLTHGTERSFMCAVCGDTFRQRSALYNHTRLLHRNREPRTRRTNAVASVKED